MLGRPARLHRATLLPSEGSAPHAEIGLTYTRGLRPTSVIIDVHSEHGSGSATVDGDDDHVFVALGAPSGHEYGITVRTTTRMLGRLWTHQQHFTAESAQRHE